MDWIVYVKGVIERKEFVMKVDYIFKVSVIIMYLRDILDIEIGGEVVENLFVFYNYMFECLGDVYVKNDLKIFDEVFSLLIFIWDVWV